MGDDHLEGWFASTPAVCAECKDRQVSAIDPWGNIPEGTVCRNCGKHPGTVKWYGEVGVMDVNHGALVFAWCECCTLKAQLEYALKIAGTVAGLREKLELSCGHGS